MYSHMLAASVALKSQYWPHQNAHAGMLIGRRVAEAWCQKRMAGNKDVTFDDLEKVSITMMWRE